MGTAASQRSKIKVPDIKINLKVDVPTFKIVLVGSCEVGKSSIYLRYTKNQFDYSYQPTLSVNIINVTKKLNVPADTLVSLTLWDMPGEEDMQLRRSYYKDINAAVDLNNQEDVEKASIWKQDIMNNTLITKIIEEPSKDGKHVEKRVEYVKADENKIPILLMGNKYDKVEEQLSEGQIGGVPEIVQALEKIAQDHEFIGSVTVSAKSGDGSVHTAMQSLVRHLIEQHLQGEAEKKRSLMKALATRGKKLQQHVQDKKEIPPEEQFHNLAVVNIKEFDEEFQQCNMSMKLLIAISSNFSSSMYNFRCACVTAGAVIDNKASVEACLHGLDSLLGDDNDLQAMKNGSIVQLVLSENNPSISVEIKKAIKIFNSEVGVTIGKITTLCPGIDARLEKREESIKELFLNMNELESTKIMSRKDVLRSREVVENNCDRIVNARKFAEKTLNTAQTVETKILGSLNW